MPSIRTSSSEGLLNEQSTNCKKNFPVQGLDACHFPHPKTSLQLFDIHSDGISSSTPPAPTLVCHRCRIRCYRRLHFLARRSSLDLFFPAIKTKLCIISTLRERWRKRRSKRKIYGQKLCCFIVWPRDHRRWRKKKHERRWRMEIM